MVRHGDTVQERSGVALSFCGRQFIKGIKRWAIWITDNSLNDALKVPEIRLRVESVKSHRENGNSVERSFKNVPHKFVTTKTAKKHQFIIPIVSSEQREYIPIGLLDKNVVITSKACTIFDQPLYVLGILLSKMHMEWVKAVSGRLGTGISYSPQICYNTFPVPDLLENEKSEIESLTENILLVREDFPNKSLAELYDPKTMPTSLRDAHNDLDHAMDKLYRDKPFSDSSDRLEHLFARYEKLIAAEKAKAPAKKTTTRSK